MAASGQRLIPLSGLNLDVAPQYLKDTQARFIKNLYYQLSDLGEAGTAQGAQTGVLKPLPSNEIYCPIALPTGNNHVIGTLPSRETNELYVFVYNSENNHIIFVIDGIAATCTIVKIDPCFDFKLEPQYFIGEGQAHLEVSYVTDPATDKELVKKDLYWTLGINNQGFLRVGDSIATNGFDATLFPYFSGTYDKCHLVRMGLPTPNDCIKIEEEPLDTDDGDGEEPPPIIIPDPIPGPPDPGTPSTPVEIIGRYYNTYQTFTAEAPTGYTNEDVTYSLAANHIASHISQEDANQKALDYCESIATSKLLRTMKAITPYVGDGYNETQGVGSMGVGSNILILEESMGVAIGDYLIVETGGEVGEGERGTVGPGGQWPYTIYDTISEMNADLTQDQGRYAGTLENGLVYRFEGIEWLPFWNNPYLKYIIPHGLDAQVTAVSLDGLTITLNKTAVVSTIDANVYFDHYYLLQDRIDNSLLTIPAGKFAISWSPYGTFNTFEIEGAGKDQTIIFSPDGSPSASLQIPLLHNGLEPVLENLTVIGGNRIKGYRFMEDEIRQPLPDGFISNDLLFLLTQGITMTMRYGTVENCKIIDPMGYGIDNIVAPTFVRDCDVILTEGEQVYQGWYFHLAGENLTGDASVVENCTFVSPTIAHAWEAFSTQDVIFRNNKSINGILAFNGAIRCVVEDMTFANTATGQPPWAQSSPWLDVNAFMGGNDRNVFRNIIITQTLLENLTTMHGIYGRENATGIEIYDSIFTKPDGTDSDPSQAIHIEATKAVVDGVIVIGTQSAYFHQFPTFANASISISGGEDTGIIKNTKADIIKVSAGVITENNQCSICR